MNTIFQIVTLAWTLQGGQYFNQNTMADGAFSSFNPEFVSLSVEGQIPFSLQKGDTNHLFIGYENFNSMVQNGTFTLTPLQETYTFISGVRVFGIELAYQHQCSHPVESISETPSKLFSSFDRFYAKVSGSF